MSPKSFLSTPINNSDFLAREPEKHTETVNDMEMDYEIHGEGEPLVLLRM